MKKAISFLLAVVCMISVLSTITFSVSAATANANVSEVKKVTVQNVGTGQYLNFDCGTLKNGTYVRVWPWDGSAEQLWDIKKVSGTTYRILTNKSNKYSLDVYRGNSKLKDGQKCDIWKNGDDATAQNVTFYLCDDGSYIIRMANNSNLALSATSSKGRVALAKFNASNKSQKWIIKDSKGNKIDIMTKSTTTKSNTTSVSDKSSGNDWNSLVGKTVASIKNGSSYTEWYNSSKNISAKGGYTGQCTWYALGRFGEVTGVKLTKAPPAKTWLSINKNNSSVNVVYGANKIVSKSIAVDESGEYGHVMFIEHVEYDSKGNPTMVYFTECNWDCNGTYNAGKDCLVTKLTYSQFVTKRSPDGYIIARNS